MRVFITDYQIDDKPSVDAILDDRIDHSVEIAVNVAANNYAFGVWKGVCAKRTHCVSG